MPQKKEILRVCLSPGIHTLIKGDALRRRDHPADRPVAQLGKASMKGDTAGRRDANAVYITSGGFQPQ
jgi:hypothetical protein